MDAKLGNSKHPTAKLVRLAFQPRSMWLHAKEEGPDVLRRYILAHIMPAVVYFPPRLIRIAI
jgi:hypothetical protein